MTEDVREREDKYDVGRRFVLPGFDDLVPAGGSIEREAIHLDSVYFDTPDRDLLRGRLTLRRRNGGEDSGWQLKVPVDGSTRDRTEIRLPLSADDEVPPPLWEIVRGVALGGRLGQIAAIRTERQVVRIKSGDDSTLVEIADDHVHTTAMGKTAQTAVLSEWREVEVEAGTAGEGVLRRIGERLVREGARLSDRPSKLATALLPVTRSGAGRRRGRASLGVRLVGDYVRQQHVALLDGDIALRREQDAVHATRVATRRLRSTLRTYGELFDPARAGALDVELAWYAQLLGEVRDRQVQRKRFAAELQAVPDELVLGPVAAEIEQALLTEQLRSLGELLEAMNSERYLKLLAEVGRWAASPPFVDQSQVSAKLVARLTARSRRKAGRRLRAALDTVSEGGAQTDEALHRARKAAKRARYAVELNSPAMKRAKPTVKHYKRLQDSLGAHQDTVVARALLRRLALRAGTTAGQNGFTYGLLFAREEAQAARLRAELAG